jgi:hypothetical protein
LLRDRGIGLARLRNGVRIILLRDRLLLHQRFVPVGQRSSGFGLRPRCLDVRLRLRRLRVIDARIDLIERLSLMNDRAFAEQAPQDHAVHLRPDV